MTNTTTSNHTATEEEESQAETDSGETSTTKVNTTEASDGGSGSGAGTPLKHEKAHLALFDFGSTSEQSSYWSADWGGEDNVRMDSTRGFYPKDSDQDQDFWIITKFPAGKHYLVNEFILKKIDWSCCRQRTISGIQIEYMQNGEWIKWNNGQIIKTGQTSGDDVNMERKIVFTTPFLATQVKVIIPVSEKSDKKWAQGRFDFSIEGPKSPPKKEVTETTGGSTTTEGGSSSSTTTTTTTTTTSSSGGSTTTSSSSGSSSSSTGSSGWMRAILDYHSPTY